MAEISAAEPEGQNPGSSSSGDEGFGNPADVMALKLKRLFAELGYGPVDPPMMLPADVVLDRLGENLRRRLLLVTSPDGREMCMRPDFTIPVAAGFLADQAKSSDRAEAAARFAYAGLAFRFPSPDEKTRTAAEFRQAGIEHFGGTKAAAADAEVLSASLAALAHLGLSSTKVTMGDVALFTDFLDALGLNTGRRKQVLYLFRQADFATDLIARLSPCSSEPDDAGPDTAFAEALISMEPNAAQAVIEEVMAMAGTKPAGGRTPAEIAQRFVEQAQTGREGPLDGKAKALLERYLGLKDTPLKVVAQLRELTKDLTSLAPAIDRYEQRLDLMQKANVDLERVTFDARFSGRIDYYTGMVFDIRKADAPDVGIIASGGRYDGFLADMGANDMTPAVGASIYVDRLVAALSQQGLKP